MNVKTKLLAIPATLLVILILLFVTVAPTTAYAESVSLSEPVPIPLPLGGSLSVSNFQSTCPIVGKNLLSNPNFKNIGSYGSSVTYTGLYGGPSAPGDGWYVFNNTQGTTKTEIVPSTFPGASSSSKMLHFQTNGASNELSQVFMQPSPQFPHPGPKKAIAAAWVYVKTGKMGIGTGDVGNTGLNTYNLTINKWEHLQAVNGNSPANTFIIVSADTEPVDFYVASACVSAAD
jgi:hypothetical protein